MRLKVLSIVGLMLAATTMAAIADTPTPPGTSVGHVDLRVNPTWAWVASVKSVNMNDATLALAKASIPTVFRGIPELELYVHPDDIARAMSALRKDATAKHYHVNFGLTAPKPKSKKPSH